MRGHAIFVERLARFAKDVDEPRVRAIARRTARNPSVAVHGRAGVGRGSVARGLAAAGVAVAGDGDVDVHVVAEVVKPEDRDRITASRRPRLVVLNKADLITGARALCTRYQTLTGVVTVPMVAHLANAPVDDELLETLRTLAATPLHVGSVDDFVSGADQLPGQARAKVLEALDLYGIGHVVRAVRAGADAAALRRLLRARSGVDGVVAALAPLLAEAAYQRVRWAVATLQALAATAHKPLAERIAAFLRDDAMVLACMASAVDVVEAAGMAVDRGDDSVAHLSRAVLWRRYQSGPVNALHHACGADIVRGSLRLWRRTEAGAVT